MAGDASGWVAAGAALAAACVVTWQSWETRKSAQASRDVVKVATDALTLSREQVSEAVRARIDAATPDIRVEVPNQPSWPPYRPSPHLNGRPQPLSPAAVPEPWRMPRDKEHLILVQTPVTIVNESDVRVSVQVADLMDDDGQTIKSPLQLEPKARISALFAVTHSLAEWIDVYTTRATSDPGPTSTTQIMYVDPADTGAIDRWTLELGGTPVVPVPNVDGAWQIAAIGYDGHLEAMRLGDTFRQRTYFLSKSRGQKLPD